MLHRLAGASQTRRAPDLPHHTHFTKQTVLNLFLSPLLIYIFKKKSFTTQNICFWQQWNVNTKVPKKVKEKKKTPTGWREKPDIVERSLTLWVSLAIREQCPFCFIRHVSSFFFGDLFNAFKIKYIYFYKVWEGIKIYRKINMARKKYHRWKVNIFEGIFHSR